MAAVAVRAVVAVVVGAADLLRIHLKSLARVSCLIILTTLTTLTTLGVATVNPTSAAAAQWHALVLGVDKYTGVPALKGAVNDAVDIAATLKKSGVQNVAVLTDEQVTRAAVVTQWARMVENSRPGDTLVMTFAGHGAQETEWIKGSERDGRDEVFLLAPFSPTTSASVERLRDDDLYSMFQAAEGRNIIFIADSCHSGTMTRSIDARIETLGTRLASYTIVRDDKLRPTLAEPDETVGDVDALDNVIFLGATADGMLTPELMIDGKPRGALSWAFSRALEGRADLDTDGIITSDELGKFLFETVRLTSEGRQLPSVIVGPAAAGLELVHHRPVKENADPLKLNIAMLGVSETSTLRQSMVPFADQLRMTEPERADLVYDARSGDILSRHGDVVARGKQNENEHVLSVISKWLVLHAVQMRGQRDGLLTATTNPAIGRIRNGNPVSVSLTADRDGSVTVVGLQPDGSLVLLAPDPDIDPSGADGRLVKNAAFQLALKAGPPFGADHVLMLHSQEPLSKLQIFVRSIEGRLMTPALASALLDTLPDEPVRVGLTGIYTYSD
ncbi:MAG: caspase family protein [Stappiaceae bacterium]